MYLLYATGELWKPTFNLTFKLPSWMGKIYVGEKEIKIERFDSSEETTVCR